MAFAADHAKQDDDRHIHPSINLFASGNMVHITTEELEKTDRKVRTVQKVTMQKTDDLTTINNTQNIVIQPAQNVKNSRIFYQIVGTVLPRASK